MESAECLRSDAAKLQRGSSCWCICWRGKTQTAALNSLSDSMCSHRPTLQPFLCLSFYIRPVQPLCNTDNKVEVCSKGKTWCRTHLAKSWRPSSRRWDAPFSLAPRDAIRKWRSLNTVMWSSVWGWVTWSSSRQRSLTHTPDACTDKHTNMAWKLQKSHTNIKNASTHVERKFSS